MNPSVPQDRRDALIASLAAALSLDPPVRNLLAMLVDRRRLDILGEVRDAYQDAFDVRSGTVRVRVASAAPLGEGERQQITDRLETATGKRVLMEVDLDPSLIGGIVVRLGGTVMDASLRQQLAGFGRHLRAH
jgi:F-type H+-transporting ATPase subunit delta